MFATAVNMFKNKDIRKRILFTCAMLFIFRFGANIPVPNVDTGALLAGTDSNSLLAMMNLLGGGQDVYKRQAWTNGSGTRSTKTAC